MQTQTYHKFKYQQNKNVTYRCTSEGSVLATANVAHNFESKDGLKTLSP